MLRGLLAYDGVAAAMMIMIVIIIMKKDACDDHNRMRYILLYKYIKATSFIFSFFSFLL